MGISHAEFFATLPRVMQDRDYRVDGSEVTHDGEAGRIHIRLLPEKQRKIASIALPVTPIEIELQGFTESRALEFLQLFDFRFQRGGG